MAADMAAERGGISIRSTTERVIEPETLESPEQGVEHRSRARVSAVAPPVRLRCARTERSDGDGSRDTSHKSQHESIVSAAIRSPAAKKLKKLKMRSELHL